MIENFDYQIYDLESIKDLEQLMNLPGLLGLNVTIPYKQQVIEYLDELSPEAAETGAVNCIRFINGKKTGFNTDVYGFRKTIDLHLKNYHHTALILGDGGAAKAVQYVFNQLDIPFKTYSRKGDLKLAELEASVLTETQIIVQCTPVGTFPHVDACIDFPFEGLANQHLVIDLIYNPSETKFLYLAAQQGAKTVNGLYMLEQQAEKAWEIWNFHEI